MVLETSVLVSAGAGLASFLSPCILPILPGFISYLSGTAINEAKNSVQDTSTTTITSSEKVESSKVLVMEVDEGSKSNNNSGRRQRRCLRELNLTFF